MFAYNTSDPDACAQHLGEAWKAIWAFLDSPDSAVRKSAAVSLGPLVKCFTPPLIAAAVRERDSSDPKAPLARIALQVRKALDSLSFARAIPELLTVVSLLISGLRYRPKLDTPYAAEMLMMPIIVKIGELRIQKTFEFKEAADAVLSTAMHVLGPHVLLRELPLNLEPADR